jgi:hypothetical protein
MRPDDNELDDGVEQFARLFDHLAQLPALRAVLQGASPSEYRRLSSEVVGGKGGKAHAVFRPVMQAALAQALGVLVHQRNQSLDGLTTKLQKLEKDGGFNMESPKSAFYGVLYDADRGRIVLVGRPLAARRLVHMLGGGTPDEKEREKLREDFADARTAEGHATNLQGKRVKPENIDLPPAV